MRTVLLIEYIFLGILGTIAFYFSEKKFLIPFIILFLNGANHPLIKKFKKSK